MATLNFTKAALERIEPPRAGRLYVQDTRTRGLTLAVTDRGVKSFYLVKRIAGRPTRVFIGRFGDVTVEQARKAADRLRGEIAGGSDPQERRRLERRQATLGDVFDHYRKTHLEPHCNVRSVKEDGRRFDKHLGCWRNRPLTSLRVEEAATLHTTIGRDTPIEANRVLELLRRVFNHGRHQFDIDKPNPTEGIKRYPEQSRERFLEPTEIKQFFVALNADPDLDVQDFVKLLLLTGVRKSNAERMRWADLDLERGLWRIPASASKNARPMVVVLPIPAVGILRSRNGGGEYVFRGEDGKLPGIKRGWERIRAASGLPDLNMHDLRRTLASWQCALGTSLAIIGKSLGHRSSRATEIYARLNLDPVRASVEAATRALLTAGGELEQGGVP